jgi:hypothetical protein
MWCHVLAAVHTVTKGTQMGGSTPQRLLEGFVDLEPT